MKTPSTPVSIILFFIIITITAFVVPNSWAQTFPTAQIVSASASSVAGNADSTHCQMGTDGQSMVFDSRATNLISPATASGVRHVYLKNRINGNLELLSAIPGSLTTGGNNDSEYPILTSEGRYVVFHSAASNLVAADSNNKFDVFIRDRLAVPATTTRLSIGATTASAVQGNDDSFYPDISEDGRYVVFLSEASNLVTDDNDGFSDIFVRDLTPTDPALDLRRVSVAATIGVFPNNSSFLGSPAISGDGRYVVFGSLASNLVASDTNNNGDIFVRDLQNGTTEIVSVPPVGMSFTASDMVFAMGHGSISRTGRYVGFGLDVGPGRDGLVDTLFVHDRNTHTTTLVPKNSIGQAPNNYSDWLRLSADGNLAIMFSAADNLLVGAPSGGTFLFNRSLNQLQLLGDSSSEEPCISADGASIGYHAQDSGMIRQIYARSSDTCPSDSNKLAPGICGCGVADTDSDADGTPNCNDACSSDASKVSAGVCGCGVADTDSDADGTANCNDSCASDPLKTSVGACGCLVADTDSDSDGTPNCNDSCPNDPAKIAAGVCGCGQSDSILDSNLMPVCNDSCPNDPLKTVPGVCGCGKLDNDSDGDRTLDCQDSCPSDNSKIAVGACGCGVSDLDRDDDAIADCIDNCPLDPGKSVVGLCGCGFSDIDKNKNIIPDCFESKKGVRLPIPRVVVVKQGRILVTAMAMSGVQYEFKLKVNSKNKLFVSKKNKLVISNLPLGTHQLSYALIYPSKKARSLPSENRKFKIKKLN